MAFLLLQVISANLLVAEGTTNGGQGTMLSVPMLASATTNIEARTILIGDYVQFPSLTGIQFYPHPETARNELHITHPWGGQKQIIISTMGTIFQDAVATPGTMRDTLVRTLFNSNTTVQENPKALNGVLESYLPSFSVALNGDKKQATVTIPSMPSYDLPADGYEVLYIVKFPSAIMDQLDADDSETILGTTNITIRQRTVYFESEIWPSPQRNFFFNVSASPPISESMLTTLAYSNFRLRFRLDCIHADYECKLAADLPTNSSKRLDLAKGIFTHSNASSLSLAEMPQGIESVTGDIATSASNVILSSDSLSLTYIVQHLANYNIIKGSVETVIAYKIPGSCFHSPGNVGGVDLVNDFRGIYQVDIIAVHAFFSGNFFVPEIDDKQALWAPELLYNPNRTNIRSYLNDVMIRKGRRYQDTPFNLTITLVGEVFASDIVTNVDKCDRSIAAMLANNNTDPTAFPKAMAHSVAQNFGTNLTE